MNKTRLRRVERKAPAKVAPNISVLEVYGSNEMGDVWLLNRYVLDSEGRFVDEQETKNPQVRTQNATEARTG